MLNIAAWMEALAFIIPCYPAALSALFAPFMSFQSTSIQVRIAKLCKESILDSPSTIEPVWRSRR